MCVVGALLWGGSHRPTCLPAGAELFEQPSDRIRFLLIDVHGPVRVVPVIVQFDGNRGCVGMLHIFPDDRALSIRAYPVSHQIVLKHIAVSDA